MNMAKALILGLFGLAATSAIAQDTAVPSSADVDALAPAPDPQLQALAETCTAHKFETIVTIEGRRRGSKVKICGEPGQTDADWLKTLRDSVRKTEADAAMAPALRTQIVTALKAEIGRTSNPVPRLRSTCPGGAWPACRTSCLLRPSQRRNIRWCRRCRPRCRGLERQPLRRPASPLRRLSARA